MVYGPQRRHAVASLATTTQALGVIQHLYTPNILILVARVLIQMQINASAFIHPSRSLFALTTMLTVMNLVAGLLHVLDFAGGMNGGKGLVLDFVGQANPASLARILLLDLLLYILQLTSLSVSYINNHSTNIPASSALPYDDLLLPPDLPNRLMTASENDEDDGELDLEGGEGPKRRRRKGKGAAYEQVNAEERELWLDDDDDKLQGGPSPMRLGRTRISEPPLIFSLPLRHIVNLILYLPAPPPPPRAFSGGTPLAGTPQTSPPITPATALPPTLPTVAEVDEGEEGVVYSRESLQRASLAVVMDMDGDSIDGLDTGRIPGEYRTGEGRGNVG
ncbi:hypothetical protein IAR55_006838 [Kwoniella newhampshirensis]|uniref:DUF1746 domain-containing protein n=1 Tax=Kwoniella newhampshirensis TaxID=1651941 RepID=A0AAW0YDM1_9TREE